MQTNKAIKDVWYNRLNKGFIKIYDDLLPEYLQNYFLNLFKSKTEPIQGFNYYYSDILTDADTPQQGEIGFGCVIHQLESNMFHSTMFSCYTPVYMLCSKLNLIPFEMLQTRAWIQIPQNSSKTFTPHVDLDIPHYVLLYYGNDVDGDTVFYSNDKKTEIKRVSPKKGRVVFFDGSIPHSASNPTTGPRFIFNYNFTAFTENDYKSTLNLYI